MGQQKWMLPCPGEVPTMFTINGCCPLIFPELPHLESLKLGIAQLLRCILGCNCSVCLRNFHMDYHLHIS